MHSVAICIRDICLVSNSYLQCARPELWEQFVWKSANRTAVWVIYRPQMHIWICSRWYKYRKRAQRNPVLLLAGHTLLKWLIWNYGWRSRNWNINVSFNETCACDLFCFVWWIWLYSEKIVTHKNMMHLSLHWQENNTNLVFGGFFLSIITHAAKFPSI